MKNQYHLESMLLSTVEGLDLAESVSSKKLSKSPSSGTKVSTSYLVGEVFTVAAGARPPGAGSEAGVCLELLEE